MTTPPLEIAVIDTSITDWETLLVGLNEGVEVILLDPAEDGIRQMANALRNYSDVSAIYLFSHGSTGEIIFGDTVVNSGNLATYSEALATIGNALTETGDILLYGCNVAQGSTGQEFIAKFAAATGADVAASDDLTGNAAAGGDWMLEAETGTVDNESLLQTFSAIAFPGLLANYYGSSGNDTTYVPIGVSTLYGGAGTDTAIVHGNRPQFVIYERAEHLGTGDPFFSP